MVSLFEQLYCREKYQLKQSHNLIQIHIVIGFIVLSDQLHTHIQNTTKSSKIEHFAKIFAKRTILHIWQRFECAYRLGRSTKHCAMFSKFIQFEFSANHLRTSSMEAFYSCLFCYILFKMFLVICSPLKNVYEVSSHRPLYKLSFRKKFFLLML